MKKTASQSVRFVVGQQIGLILVTVAAFLTQKGGAVPIWLAVLLAIWQVLLLWQYYVIYRTSSRT